MNCTKHQHLFVIFWVLLSLDLSQYKYAKIAFENIFNRYLLLRYRQLSAIQKRFSMSGSSYRQLQLWSFF